MTTLTITGTNLTTNKTETRTFKASNVFGFVNDYQKAIREISIEDWTLKSKDMEGGNNGLNAEVYLVETMEEFTGIRF
jgi:hypothetical protein